MSKGNAWEHIIESFYGRWVVLPILVVIAVIVGAGLVLELSGLGDKAPTWIHGAFGAVGVTAYYGFQVRSVLAVNSRKGGVHADHGVAIGSQRNEPGAIAPTIHGPATFNIGMQPSTVPVKDELDADEAVDVLSADLANPTVSPVPSDNHEESRLDVRRIVETLEVPPGDHEALEIAMAKGETVEGTFRSDAPINVYVMTENQYLSYWGSREPGTARVIAEDESSGKVRWKAPRPGMFHLVFDTYGKQVSRTVRVSLAHKPPRT